MLHRHDIGQGELPDAFTAELTRPLSDAVFWGETVVSKTDTVGTRCQVHNVRNELSRNVSAAGRPENQQRRIYQHHCGNNITELHHQSYI